MKDIFRLIFLLILSAGSIFLLIVMINQLPKPLQFIIFAAVALYIVWALIKKIFYLPVWIFKKMSSKKSYDADEISDMIYDHREKIDEINRNIEIQKSLNRARSSQEKKEKGDAFEKYCAEHFESLGYQVQERGKLLGVKDGGIDLIAFKDDEVLLIQCKNWNGNIKITSKELRVFYGDCSAFIEAPENKDFIEEKGYKIRRLYIVSKDDMYDYSATSYSREMNGRIEIYILNFE